MKSAVFNGRQIGLDHRRPMASHGENTKRTSEDTMMRRSTAAKKLDERRFPVRVRIKTPLPLGFGRKLDEPGIPEASLWYFNDVEVARFGCQALIVESR
jgi:hypothetical protein